MIIKILLILLLFYVYKVYLLDMGPKVSETYGPFVSDYSRSEKCQGPKSKTAADYNLTLTKDEYGQMMDINMTYYETTRVDEIKIIVYSVKGNRKNVLYSYRVDKPCTHFALAMPIEKHFNGKNCIIKKGDYTVQVNCTDYTKTFFGESFFYGEYILKSVVQSATKGNIMCLVLDVIFRKRT